MSYTREGTGREKVQLILVVEDDTDIGELVRDVLNDEPPYQAMLVTSGPQALETVKVFKPRLFLLDYHLPKMNGIELYDKLHSIEGLEATPTLFMSANVPQEELEKRHVALLKKPFDLNDLVQTVEKLVVTS